LLAAIVDTVEGWWTVGEIFIECFIANFLENMSAKEFLKSVSIS